MSVIRWRSPSFLHNRESKRLMRQAFLFKVLIVVGGTAVLLMAFYLWFLISGSLS